MKKFSLKMLTPERTFFDGEVVSVTVVDDKGELQLLADYLPVVVPLRAATIRIDDGNEKKICANGEGFLAVGEDAVYIMCQTYEWPEEIEIDRVNRAIAEHTEMLGQSMDEYKKTFHELTLDRAHARLSLLALMREKNKMR